MGCTSCSTDKTGVPNGCKSNGSCATGSCDKLNVFDWLSNMSLPSGQKPLNIVEVRFKNGRKHFYRNTNNFQLSMGEIVAVEGSPGHDVGTVSLTGELIRVQMKKKKISEDSDEIKKIYRKATVRDIDIWQAARDKEVETQRRGREILGRLNLKMKLSDVEYQGDGNKATFYYTAEERVDFRQLIKDLASAFNIRIEMKQVGLRQEAARLGGVGSCGRELCCSTWLTDFRKVNTASARYQQLSLNPQKLAGQCGKLKCCLNFELDTYLDALKGFPKQDIVLETEKGKASFVKMDIFKELLWYSSKEEGYKWYKLTLEQVKEVIQMNKQGEKAPSLEELESETEVATKIDFENVVGQDSLTRFDKPKSNNRKKKRRNSKANKTGKDSTNSQKNKVASPKNEGESIEKGRNNNPKRKKPRSKPTNSTPQKEQEAESKANKDGVEKKAHKPKRRRPQNKNRAEDNRDISAKKQERDPSSKKKKLPLESSNTERKSRPNRNNRKSKSNKENPGSNSQKDA